MGETNKADGQIPEQEAAGQEPTVQEAQQIDMDAGEQTAASDGVQEAAGLAPGYNGPEDEAELAEGVLQPYVVAFKGVLCLRQEPSLDAPLVAVLPCGAGVFADGEPGPEGWLHVLTGKLSGWMMAEHLEVLPLPELGNGTD